MGKNAELQEKQKWSHEKPKLDNARKLRGICFIGPEDKEFKETIKSARKKLETPMSPAMPCTIVLRTVRIVGVVHPMRSNQVLRVFWKLVNLQDYVWENHCQIIMNSITIWFTNLFLSLKP